MALWQEIKGNKTEKDDVAGGQELYTGEWNRNVEDSISFSEMWQEKSLGLLMCCLARHGLSAATGVGSFDVTLNIGSRGGWDKVSSAQGVGARKSRLPPQYICNCFPFVFNLSYFQGFLFFLSPMSCNRNGVECVKPGVGFSKRETSSLSSVIVQCSIDSSEDSWNHQETNFLVFFHVSLKQVLTGWYPICEAI